MSRGEILHEAGARMGVDSIDEILGLHTKERMALAYGFLTLTPQVHGKGLQPAETVTELLRLARIGAIAEAESKAAGDTPVRTVVRDARRRWRLELGII